MIVLLGLLSGCFQNFYKVTRITSVPPEAFLKMQEENKYFILHSGDFAFAMDSFTVGSNSLTCIPNHLPDFRKAYMTTNIEGPTRYTKKDVKNQSYILEEVHIYADIPAPLGTEIQIPIDAIYKVEIYEHDKKATSNSTLRGLLGIAAGIAASSAIIFSTSKKPEPTYTPSTPSESCPFIYVLDGQTEQFVGEIYSGAIYPSLERHDYLTLPNPLHEQRNYTVRMSNELREVQVEVFDQYLPEMLSDEELTAAVKAIIEKVGAELMKDLGRVMGMAAKELAGKADGKDIAAKVKAMLQ